MCGFIFIQALMLLFAAFVHKISVYEMAKKEMKWDHGKTVSPYPMGKKWGGGR